MAKLTSPLMSLDARGKFGNCLVFQKRGNKNLVRFQLAQKDILTPRRIIERAKYQNAVLSWNSLEQSTKDFYINMAIGKNFSGYNLYLKMYILGDIIDSDSSIYGFREYGIMFYGKE
jgi:hypothetical protein